MAGILSAGQADTVAPLTVHAAVFSGPTACVESAFQILQTLMSLPGTEGQVRAEGVFVLRLFDHLPPLLTGPKFFPALEEADQSSNRGKDGASGFKPGNSPFWLRAKCKGLRVVRHPMSDVHALVLKTEVP